MGTPLATVRSVDGVVRDLIAPLLPLERESGTGWRLVGWDAEHGISLTLSYRGAVLLVELEERDDTRECYARTDRFNVCVRRQFERGVDLEPEHRRGIDQVLSIIRAREARLPDVDRESAARRSEVRELEVERVLMSEGPGHYYLNPYVGCMIGCGFCYVSERADFSRRLEALPKLEWGRWVDVKVNAADVLRREIVGREPGLVRLSPILTDPYQPLERRYRITRQCLEVLLEHGFTPVILTRAARVLDDLDLLRRFPRAAVGLSIPTDDDAMRVHFEPGGDPIPDRLEALEKLHEAGVRTFAVIQPMLPMNAAKFADRLAPLVRAVRIDRMHELPRVQHLYEAAGRLDALTDAFFERTERELREGFARHGVPIDEADDLTGVLGL